MEKTRGFTLIELMIVAAIIGIIAAIATPKFADLIRKSGEGASKGNLGMLRSALSIYYSDLEGQYPSNLSALTAKNLNSIPLAKAPYYHADSSSEVDDLPVNVTDAGGWLYDNVASDVNMGTVLVNCTHTDSKGSVWTSY